MAALISESLFFFFETTRGSLSSTLTHALLAISTLFFVTNLVLSFFLELHNLLFLLIFLTLVTVLKKFRGVMASIFTLCTDILSSGGTLSGARTAFYQWGRREILKDKLSKARTLSEYKLLSVQLQSTLPPGIIVPPSSVALHSSHLLEEAMANRDGVSLLFQLHSATTHFNTIHSLRDQELLLMTMAAGLELILADQPHFLGAPLDTVRQYIHSMRVYLGSTALCLSGGGALALAHFGVVKSLHDTGLLPRIISGTSGGSIVAAAVCIATDPELKDLLRHPEHLVGYVPLRDRLGGVHPSLTQPKRSNPPLYFEPFSTQLLNFATLAASGSSHPTLLSSEHFLATLRDELGCATFLSAFKKSGKILCISVCARLFTDCGVTDGQPLILSYISSPHVLIYSAVGASCSLPGLLAPSTLLAVNERGETVAFHPPGIAALDGSLIKDIPSEELSLVFQVRRFIVSQTNPHITHLLNTNPREGDVGLVRSLDMFINYLHGDIRERFSALASRNLVPKVLGISVVPLTNQIYTSGGHSSLPGLTLVPTGPVMSFWNALRQPTAQSLKDMSLAGERATWPHLAFAEKLTSLERLLIKCSLALAPQPPLDVLFRELKASQQHLASSSSSSSASTSTSTTTTTTTSIPRVLSSWEFPPPLHSSTSPTPHSLVSCVDFLTRLNLMVVVLSLHDSNSSSSSTPAPTIIYSSPAMTLFAEGEGKPLQLLHGYTTSPTSSDAFTRGIRSPHDVLAFILSQHPLGGAPSWTRVFLTTGGGTTEARVGILTPLTLEESVAQRALFGGEEVVELTHLPPMNLSHLAKDLHKAQLAGEVVGDALLHIIHARTLIPESAATNTAATATNPTSTTSTFTPTAHSGGSAIHINPVGSPSGHLLAGGGGRSISHQITPATPLHQQHVQQQQQQYHRTPAPSSSDPTPPALSTIGGVDEDATTTSGFRVLEDEFGVPHIVIGRALTPPTPKGRRALLRKGNLLHAASSNGGGTNTNTGFTASNGGGVGAGAGGGVGGVGGGQASPPPTLGRVTPTSSRPILIPFTADPTAKGGGTSSSSSSFSSSSSASNCPSSSSHALEGGVRAPFFLAGGSYEGSEDSSHGSSACSASSLSAISHHEICTQTEATAPECPPTL